MITKYTPAITLIVLQLSSSANAIEKEPYCNWDDEITFNRITDSDEQMFYRISTDSQNSIKEHIPFGAPSTLTGNNEHMLVNKEYLVWYDDDLRIPLWTAHHLTKEDAQVSRKRADSFRSDSRLKFYEKSDCADYKEPIFDQGHMVPRADMNKSDAAMDSTYLMSNITPQHCAFNRGIWQVLEKQTRNWAKSIGELWVISGSILDRDGTRGRDHDQAAWRMQGKWGPRVAIPSHLFKILIQRDGDRWKSLSFIIPNTDTKISDEKMEAYIKRYISSIDMINAMTGLTFLEHQDVTESSTLWDFTGDLPKSLADKCDESYSEF